MPSLKYSYGDSDAIRACIAIAANPGDVEVSPTSEPRSISFELDNKTVLTDPNAIARYIGGATLVPEEAALQIEEWLEIEERVRQFLPYSLLSANADLIRKLASAVDGKEYVVGQQLSLADVALYATLLPALTKYPEALPQSVRSYLEKLTKLPAISNGLAQALGKKSKLSLPAAANAPIAPIPGQRNILITSALPYVNNVPHLGNIIGCVLSADCYARYCRSRGYNCIYICGTDEYGTATETKALEEGMTCQEICDKYNAIHREIYEWFDIHFDKFGRTPTWQQTEIAQGIYNVLEEAKQLVEQESQQLYSEAAGKFLADRFVTGTCPKCGYEDARGDQCDQCGNLLAAEDLINPKCKLTGTVPVLRPTKHVYLDLPALTPQLQAYITSSSQAGGWSSNCVQVTNAWMRDGLKLRCITRDLKWGTPVPRPGYEDKVFYVWFDAPIGYISITANYTQDWQAWWQNPENVDLVQFMGKDNVPFHTVIFPATLLGTRQDWTLMKSISVTEYLNYEGGKFSKSRGVGVFGNDAKDTGIPVEVWRYFLLSNRPETSDTDFKWSDLAAKNNSELLANLGNFVNRSLSFAATRYGGVVPAATCEAAQPAIAELNSRVGPLVEQYVAALEKIKLKEGIRLVMTISAAGNKFFQDTRPWVLVKEDKEQCGALVNACAGLCALLAALVEPYMPSITQKLLEQLNWAPENARLSDELIAKAAAVHTIIPAGHRMGQPQVLFRTIPKEEEEALRARFAGSQADRASAAASASTSAPSKAQSSASSTPQAKGAKPSGGKPAASEQTNGAAPGKADKGSKGKNGRPVDLSLLHLKVGVIKEAKRHPDADTLYVEEIDCGEPEPRTVVSGLAKYIPLEAMQGRRVVLVANLKPANMRGVKSQAMVLAATSTDDTTVELVEPPGSAAPGDRVTADGFDGEPEEQLNPKKKQFEQIQPDLLTNADCIACYKGLPLKTKEGPCKVSSIVGGSIK
ncbi:g11266 [Coccomyxa elongata]